MKKDFLKSIRFIQREKPVIGKGLVIVCNMNFFLSAMLMVGLPYLITEVLDFPAAKANQLYGFAEGALAAGGLIGGIGAGIFSGRLAIQKAGNLIIACVLSVFPMGLALALIPSDFMIYLIITVCCFAVMIFSTVFTVLVFSFI